MRDPRDLYSFESADVLAAVPRGGLTLLHSLPGVVDAGSVCRIASTYLRDSLRHVRLVSFDVDELIDYRGSRPQAAFEGSAFTRVDLPQITLSLLYDESDRPFLLLDGPEPDLQWKRLAQAVVDLVEYFEVERVVGIQGVPMAAPHTRPIGLFEHANDPALLDGAGSSADGVSEDGGEIVVPASFGALLELELGRAGHGAMGYAAQIPHYLTRTDFPAGALALLRRVSTGTGLDLPLRDLGDLTEAATTMLESTLDQNQDVQQIVAALEEQHDSAGGAGEGPASSTVDLPTADELGDHFERFLADQGGDGPDGPPER